MNEHFCFSLFCFDLIREKSSICVWWERQSIERKMMMHLSKGTVTAIMPFIADRWGLTHRWSCCPKSEMQIVHFASKEGRAKMPDALNEKMQKNELVYGLWLHPVSQWK